MTPTVDPRTERTRAVVIDAAADLLEADGFEQVTIEAIAHRSGVARSTIYRNWPDRSELLTEAFERLCAFPGTGDLGSLEAELRAFGNELADGLANRAWGRVLPSLIGAAAHDTELEAAQRAFSERRRALVSPIFERAIRRGDLPDTANPPELAEAFASGFFFRHLVTHAPLDDAFIESQIGRAIGATVDQRSSG